MEANNERELKESKRPYMDVLAMRLIEAFKNKGAITTMCLLQLTEESSEIKNIGAAEATTPSKISVCIATSMGLLVAHVQL
jgi:hypothetical protein